MRKSTPEMIKQGKSIRPIIQWKIKILRAGMHNWRNQARCWPPFGKLPKFCTQYTCKGICFHCAWKHTRKTEEIRKSTSYLKAAKRLCPSERVRRNLRTKRSSYRRAVNTFEVQWDHDSSSVYYPPRANIETTPLAKSCLIHWNPSM